MLLEYGDVGRAVRLWTNCELASMLTLGNIKFAGALMHFMAYAQTWAANKTLLFPLWAHSRHISVSGVILLLCLQVWCNEPVDLAGLLQPLHHSDCQWLGSTTAESDAFSLTPGRQRRTRADKKTPFACAIKSTQCLQPANAWPLQIF